MKKLLLVLTTGLLIIQLQAQSTDSVSMGGGSTTYPLDVYYNITTGAKDTARNTNWHIAFSVRNAQPPMNVLLAATVRINMARGVTVYKSTQGPASWNNFDTTNWRNWTLVRDSDTSWDIGALNQGRTNGFDFGWGDYSMNTHHIDGKVIYLFAIRNGANTVYKKLMINQLTLDTTWNFTFANLNNTDSNYVSFNKAAFTGKMFAYYNILNKTMVDREPARANWDILFTRYHAKVNYLGVDTFYNVTGALINPENVMAARVSGVNRDSANRYMVTAYSSLINTIGWDWKVSPMGPPTLSWPIVDSLTYFIKKGNLIYKLLFDRFDANPNMIVFNKSSIDVTSVSETSNAFARVLAYPNPAKTDVTIEVTTAANNALLSIVDITGKTVYEINMESADGGFRAKIYTDSMGKGIYFYNVETPNGMVTGKFIVE
ncbi:MAG: T9SS type A sorting domain-containing protein [Bacteroidota bacterium]|jgi:hypothetical protein